MKGLPFSVIMQKCFRWRGKSQSFASVGKLAYHSQDYSVIIYSAKGIDWSTFTLPESYEALPLPKE